jgi:hypothetical protein
MSASMPMGSASTQRTEGCAAAASAASAGISCCGVVIVRGGRQVVKSSLGLLECQSCAVLSRDSRLAAAVGLVRARPHLHVPPPGKKVRRDDDAAGARGSAPPNSLLDGRLSQLHMGNLNQSPSRHSPASAKKARQRLGHARGRRLGRLRVTAAAPWDRQACRWVPARICGTARGLLAGGCSPVQLSKLEQHVV